MVNLLHRGVVGEMPKGGRKALFGALYLAMGVGMFWVTAWGLSNGIDVSGCGVLLIMWVLALGDAIDNIACSVSWIVDDEEAVY